MINQYLARLNQRERMLAIIVGGVLFLLVNLFIWNTLLNMSAGARTRYAELNRAREEQQAYLQDEKTWKTRAEWLKKKQPKSNNPAEASSLLEQVKSIAGKYNVQVENPQIGPVENAPTYKSISATFETKSSWEPLVHFLYDTQKPENFTVFENVNLMVDASDPAVMQGRFKVAKWFAPGGQK